MKRISELVQGCCFFSHYSVLFNSFTSSSFRIVVVTWTLHKKYQHNHVWPEMMKIQCLCCPVAEFVSCATSEGGAEDAERTEGVFRSSGERCAAGSGSWRESHRQISGKSHLTSQSAASMNATLIIAFRSISVSKAFKNFSVQYEMKKKQTEPLLQPVHRDGKLSVDQALVKQAWDRVSARVSAWIIYDRDTARRLD